MAVYATVDKVPEQVPATLGSEYTSIKGTIHASKILTWRPLEEIKTKNT